MTDEPLSSSICCSSGVPPPPVFPQKMVLGTLVTPSRCVRVDGIPDKLARGERSVAIGENGLPSVLVPCKVVGPRPRRSADEEWVVTNVPNTSELPGPAFNIAVADDDRRTVVEFDLLFLRCASATSISPKDGVGGREYTSIVQEDAADLVFRQRTVCHRDIRVCSVDPCAKSIAILPHGVPTCSS